MLYCCLFADNRSLADVPAEFCLPVLLSLRVYVPNQYIRLAAKYLYRDYFNKAYTTWGQGMIHMVCCRLLCLDMLT